MTKLSPNKPVGRCKGKPTHTPGVWVGWFSLCLCVLAANFFVVAPSPCEELVNPARIIRIEKGDIYIDIGGGTGVKAGDEFEVYREKEEELVHPISGKRLGYLQKRIGKIRIKWAREKFSIASVLACQPDEEFKAMDAVIPHYTKPRRAEPGYGGILRGAFIHEPQNLDPTKVISTPGFVLISCLYDTLLKVEASGELLPSLAQRWEVKQDGQSIVFYLKEGVEFHDGEVLSAEDVKYSFDRLLKSGKGSWAQVKENVIIDDHTIRIDLSTSDPLFLTVFAHPTTSILPQNLLKEAGESFFSHPVGTGPFNLKEWVRGKEIALAANGKYFRGKPYLDPIFTT